MAAGGGLQPCRNKLGVAQWAVDRLLAAGHPCTKVLRGETTAAWVQESHQTVNLLSRKSRSVRGNGNLYGTTLKLSQNAPEDTGWRAGEIQETNSTRLGTVCAPEKYKKQTNSTRLGSKENEFDGGSADAVQGPLPAQPMVRASLAQHYKQSSIDYNTCQPRLRTTSVERTWPSAEVATSGPSSLLPAAAAS